MRRSPSTVILGSVLAVSALALTACGGSPPAAEGCQMAWSGSESGSVACDAFLQQAGSFEQLSVSNASTDTSDPLIAFDRTSFKPMTYKLADFTLVSVIMPGSTNYALVDAYDEQPLQGASATVTLTATSTDVKANATHGTLDLTLVQYDGSACATSSDLSTCGVGKGRVTLNASF